MCNIWQQSLLVLCSSTVKELVPVIVEYTNSHSITQQYIRTSCYNTNPFGLISTHFGNLKYNISKMHN